MSKLWRWKEQSTGESKVFFFEEFHFPQRNHSDLFFTIIREMLNNDAVHYHVIKFVCGKAE
jgi:hypothetical protein